MRGNNFKKIILRQNFYFRIYHRDVDLKKVVEILIFYWDTISALLLSLVHFFANRRVDGLSQLETHESTNFAK